MRIRILTALLLVPAGCFAAAAPTFSEYDVAVPMRDGVRLSTNIFRPAGFEKYPTILLRTPYDKGTSITVSSNYQSFVNHGYAVVVQDVRGRYKSGGNFEPVNQEINDGDDTLNWIAKQAWSDGKVGMYGGSYLGIAQWKAAMSHNPHLKAIFPYVSGDDDYRDRFYSSGGALKLGHRLLWLEENMRNWSFRAPDFGTYVATLPERSADQVVAGTQLGLWSRVVNHPAYDRFWKGGSVREHLREIDIPVYSVGGWYDNYVESDLDAYSILAKRSHVDRIMIGPWPHVFSEQFPGVNFGPDAQVSLRPEQLKWFDHWLKDKETPEVRHPVRLFVMGINRWRDEDNWPLARARDTKFYLRDAGNLGVQPERRGGSESFVYDPKNPVPTTGGAVCCNPAVFPWGPKDQRSVEKRADVLVYSTPPLSVDTEVTGPVKLVLYAASTALDTDFTAKLVDVFPDGTARNLTDGLLRTRYRDSLENPQLMAPGTVYRLTINAGVTSNVFRAGHRIRLEISSSNFPRFDRNPNTGKPVAEAKELKKAAQTVFHDQLRPSYLLLPVVPAAPLELTSGKHPRYVPKSGGALAARSLAVPSEHMAR